MTTDQAVEMLGQLASILSVLQVEEALLRALLGWALVLAIGIGVLVFNVGLQLPGVVTVRPGRPDSGG